MIQKLTLYAAVRARARKALRKVRPLVCVCLIVLGGFGLMLALAFNNYFTESSERVRDVLALGENNRVYPVAMSSRCSIFSAICQSNDTIGLGIITIDAWMVSSNQPSYVRFDKGTLTRIADLELMFPVQYIIVILRVRREGAISYLLAFKLIAFPYREFTMETMGIGVGLFTAGLGIGLEKQVGERPHKKSRKKLATHR